MLTISLIFALDKRYYDNNFKDPQGHQSEATLGTRQAQTDTLCQSRLGHSTVCELCHALDDLVL